MKEEIWNLPESEEGNKVESTKIRKFEKLSTFDWLALNNIWDVRQYNIFEISYKDGSRKEFARNQQNLVLNTGDWVLVDTGSGYDIGIISLSGDLVRLQMKKRKVSEDRELNTIIRLANNWEIEKLAENKSMEYNTLVRARAIAASLNLNMKLGEVEYQADRKKATFFYTSVDRVDFRELVKEYAREFKIKVEMRQIGIRQESSKIGGIGSCGRELCCSTWHTNFTSVTTDMVKYQNLSVNQSKLTGLCGRLKCCLNYELDIYLEALEDFPKNSEILQLEFSSAYFVKLDIFKGLMYYTIKNDKEKNKIYALTKERVSEIIYQNKQGIKPTEMGSVEAVNTESGENFDFEDVTGQIELREKKRNKKPNKNRSKSQKKENNANRPKPQNPIKSEIKSEIENNTKKILIPKSEIKTPQNVSHPIPNTNTDGIKKKKNKFKRFPPKSKKQE
jgi:cell fate regulator YaaT (PSP1 superfamily)